jgi:hypothetical protein
LHNFQNLGEKMIKKLLFTILLGLSAFANTLTVGSTIPTLTIKDQFEKDYIVDANIKTIIFSATKTEGTTIKEFLLTKDKDYLTTNKTVYIADITGMPSLITKFIAMPKMKDYSEQKLKIHSVQNKLFQQYQQFLERSYFSFKI